MSKKSILSKLKAKGIVPIYLNYERDQVEGGGFWLIELCENTEQALIDLGFPENDIESQFENLADVLAFVESIPKINPIDLAKIKSEQ